jgi:hypothetical protein
LAANRCSIGAGRCCWSIRRGVLVDVSQRHKDAAGL